MSLLHPVHQPPLGWVLPPIGAPAQPFGLSLSDWGRPLFDNRTAEKLARAVLYAFSKVSVSRSAVTAVHGVAGGTSPDVREGRWRADYPMIQINAAALLPPTMEHGI
jgi:hypothetical protein